jgi:hypothetical protein
MKQIIIMGTENVLSIKLAYIVLIAYFCGQVILL